MVAAIMAVLASAALPLGKHAAKRSKEMQLRTNLRMLRNSIDEFKRFSDAGLIPVELGTDGYPEDMEVLIEGVDLVGQIDKRFRFLRRIPVDPMTGEAEWGKRSFQDDWDSNSWGGENLFDVYSLSRGTGLNGVPYGEW
jgi:general secretion pathway protein G